MRKVDRDKGMFMDRRAEQTTLPFTNLMLRHLTCVTLHGRAQHGRAGGNSCPSTLQKVELEKGMYRCKGHDR